MTACTHGMTAGCVVHHRPDLYEERPPKVDSGTEKVRAIDLGDQEHLLRIVRDREAGHRPAAFLHEPQAKYAAPQRRPQGPDTTRQTYGRLTKPEPVQPPQWQPQLDAQAKRKAARITRAEIDTAVDLTPSESLQALAAKLGVNL